MRTIPIVCPVQAPSQIAKTSHLNLLKERLNQLHANNYKVRTLRSISILFHQIINPRTMFCNLSVDTGDVFGSASDSPAHDTSQDGLIVRSVTNEGPT